MSLDVQNAILNTAGIGKEPRRKCIPQIIKKIVFSEWPKK